MNTKQIDLRQNYDTSWAPRTCEHVKQTQFFICDCNKRAIMIAGSCWLLYCCFCCSQSAIERRAISLTMRFEITQKNNSALYTIGKEIKCLNEHKKRVFFFSINPLMYFLQMFFFLQIFVLNCVLTVNKLRRRRQKKSGVLLKRSVTDMTLLLFTAKIAINTSLQHILYFND